MKKPSAVLPICPVILGTWALCGWMRGGFDRSEAFRTLSAAVDRGVDGFDTAGILTPANGRFMPTKTEHGAPAGTAFDCIFTPNRCVLNWSSRCAAFKAITSIYTKFIGMTE